MRNLRGLGLMGGAVLAMAAMLGGPAIVPLDPPARKRARPVAYGGGRSRTTSHTMNGKRECARRLRQIAAGSLRAENGLVS